MGGEDLVGRFLQSPGHALRSKATDFNGGRRVHLWLPELHDAEGHRTPRVPVMEIHGFIDENQLYTNTVNWGLVDENRPEPGVHADRSGREHVRLGGLTTAAKAHCPTATSPEPSTAFRAFTDCGSTTEGRSSTHAAVTTTTGASTTCARPMPSGIASATKPVRHARRSGISSELRPQRPDRGMNPVSSICLLPMECVAGPSLRPPDPSP